MSEIPGQLGFTLSTNSENNSEDETPVAKDAISKPYAQSVNKTVSTPQPPKPVIPKKVAEEPVVYSVNDLSRLIKSSLESKFPIVWVKGEISNFKPHYSGHWYFNLKDEKSQISAVMFKAANQKLKINPEDGMEVIVRGRITVYEPRGTYQLMCELIEPVGLGELQKAFEKLKNKLAAEGLFALERKRPLPRFPTRIAIVTSPTGAAIRDMINVITRRFKGLEVVLIPTPVQGAGSASEIAKAIRLANLIKPAFDVMIVGRGGGSIEDLWAFNEEVVARAIYTSEIPVISAVGHEIDFTIADFVADLRAPTPSAAAELVVENALQLCAQVSKYERSLLNIIRSRLVNWKLQVTRLARHIVDPKKRITDANVRCLELISRLERLMDQGLESRKQDLDLLGGRLEDGTLLKLKEDQQYLSKLMGLLGSFNPLAVVERGYSIVTIDGKIVKKASEVKAGDEVGIQLASGKLKAVVNQILER